MVEVCGGSEESGLEVPSAGAVVVGGGVERAGEGEIVRGLRAVRVRAQVRVAALECVDLLLLRVLLGAVGQQDERTQQQDAHEDGGRMRASEVSTQSTTTSNPGMPTRARIAHGLSQNMRCNRDF